MSRIILAAAMYTFASILCIAPWSGNASAQEADAAVDPETWVYESAVKDGELRFKTFREWAGSQSKNYRPLTIFVDRKLGCKPPIDAIWTDNISSDWFARMTGAPKDMLMMDRQYVVAEGYMFKSAGSRGFMILDVVNRWAAFAMTHSEDHWNHVDGGRQGILYSEEYQRDYHHYYFSLFLVDPSSEMFRKDATLLARLWIESYGFGGKQGLIPGDAHRYYPDDIPMKIYEVRCGDTE